MKTALLYLGLDSVLSAVRGYPMSVYCSWTATMTTVYCYYASTPRHHGKEFLPYHFAWNEINEVVDAALSLHYLLPSLLKLLLRVAMFELEKCGALPTKLKLQSPRWREIISATCNAKLSPEQ